MRLRNKQTSVRLNGSQMERLPEAFSAGYVYCIYKIRQGKVYHVEWKLSGSQIQFCMEMEEGKGRGNQIPLIESGIS